MGNWTFNEFKECIDTTFYVEGENVVTLDVSDADWRNMKDIKCWATEMGYKAIEINSDTIRVEK